MFCNPRGDNDFDAQMFVSALRRRRETNGSGGQSHPRDVRTGTRRRRGVSEGVQERLGANPNGDSDLGNQSSFLHQGARKERWEPTRQHPGQPHQTLATPAAPLLQDWPPPTRGCRGWEKARSRSAAPASPSWEAPSQPGRGCSGSAGLAGNPRISGRHPPDRRRGPTAAFGRQPSDQARFRGPGLSTVCGPFHHAFPTSHWLIAEGQR
jgi:hypothetical protein